MTNTNRTTLMQAIDTAYNDAEVQKLPDLTKLLLKSAQQLESGRDDHQVAGELHQALKYWGMAHLHGPKALDPLSQLLTDNSRGLAYQKPYAPQD
ncbi:bacteriocin immunity protein [Lactiplantibacillus dongliensis]|uniref:Bacteriocin immunity protein n=1 Tax=Lactiplantibacillus dongliensis TaxID=2559919 RepID=A0ABW1RAC8_9LACO|nr:bacteriocin immunity protein [Lactiplantibacillus dongliensis]